MMALSACNLSPDAREASYIEKGKKEFARRNYGVAILHFRNASEAKPWDAEPHYQLGLAYMAGGDAKSAYLDWKKATELNPRHTGAQLKLAATMAASRDKDDLDEAKKHAQAVLAVSPDDPEALDVLAAADLRLGNPEAAQSALEQAVRKSPGHVKSWAGLSEVKLSRKDAAGAENALREACLKAPRSAEARTYLAEFYANQGRIPEAEQQFRQALAIDPKNGPALLDLGRLQAKAGQNERAEQTFRQVSALHDGQYKPVHAEFLFQTGNRDQAVAEFAKLAAADPGDVNLRTKLVQAYVSLQRVDDAEKVLTAAIEKNATDAVALMQRGRIYLDRGKYAEAQADMNRVLQFRKDSADAHYLLARIGEERANTYFQKRELEETLQLNPSFLEARIDLAQVLLSARDARAALVLVDEAPNEQVNAVAMILKRNWALLALGRTAEARQGVDRLLPSGKVPEAFVQDAAIRLAGKDYAGARKSAETALKMAPEDTRALYTLVETYTAQKQAAAAVLRVREFALARPASAPMQQLLGKMLAASGDRAGARKAFEAAKAAAPNSQETDYSLAELDAAEGKTDDARRRLLGVVSSHPDNKAAHLVLAEFEMTKGGNTAAAIDQYRKVLAIDGEDAMAWNALAYMLAQSKQPDEALKSAQKAKQLAPDSAAVDDTLGWVYYLQGSYPLSVVHLEAATSKQGTAVRKYHLAMAYLKAGKPDRGRETLEAALRMNPNLPEAQAARQAFGMVK
jgi:tetratricopeptide (TPR) repeat protein